MRQRVIFFCAALFILTGTVLMMTSALTTRGGPSAPASPTYSAPASPAGTLSCLGTDDEPAGCP